RRAETHRRRGLAVHDGDLARLEGDRLRVAAIHHPDDAETDAAIEPDHRLHQRSFNARIRATLARPRARPAVVGDERVERQRRTGGDDALRRALDLDRRRIVLFAERAGTAAILLVGA